MPITVSAPKDSRTYAIPGMETAWPKLGRLKAGECPRVSTILDQALPNHGLIKWAADVEANVQREVWTSAILRAGPTLAEKLAYVDMQLGGIREHQRVKEHAGNIGSYAHALVESHVLRMLNRVAESPLPPKQLTNDQIQAARMAATAAKEWIEEVSLKPRHIEQTVFDRELRVAGTLDLAGTVQGRDAIVDWKSSKAIYLPHLVQVAGAYCSMAPQCGITDTSEPDAWIVQLPKTLEIFQRNMEKYKTPIHAVRLTDEEQKPFRRLWVESVCHYRIVKESEAALRKVLRDAGEAAQD